MKYYVDTDNRRLNKYDERTQPVVAPADKPRLYFGEKPTITLAFSEGVLVAGRLLVVAVDADMRHGENMTPPMVKAVVEILPANVLTGEVAIELTTNTQRFYEMTNGLPVNGCRQGAFGVYLRDAETGVYDTLCADIALCYGIVADDTDPVVILPEEIYYTKEQINVIVAQMQAALEGATAAKNAAQTAAANAVGSAGDSYIWAEGTDAQALCHHTCILISLALLQP